MKKFITFEGGEGTGKTTQSKLLSKSLLKIKEDNLLTREPGGTFFSEKIRKLLVNNREDNISVETEFLLIYASRFQHLKEKVVPALKNKTVICDRYIHSTYCYQDGIKNLEKKIKFIHKYFAYNLMPDLTILIDLPPEEGIRRSLKIKKVETRFEKKDLLFHKGIRQKFLRLSNKNKNIFKIDGLCSKKDIHTQIINYLNSKLYYKKKLPYII